MQRASNALALGAFGCLALATRTHAHEREFTLSRDWFLPYVGESEIESRTFWDTRNNDLAQSFEYEFGVAEWFAVEPGISFHRGPGEDLEWEGVDLELRFHFGDFAYGAILPALNVEYEHPREGEEPDHGELKFIFSRYGEDGQDFALNINVGKELEQERESESEITFGYVRPLEALGEHAEHGEHGEHSEAGWHYGPRLGIEAIEDLKEHHTGVGPVAVYRPTQHLNFLASYVFGVDDRNENPDQLRLIVEWEF